MHICAYNSINEQTYIHNHINARIVVIIFCQYRSTSGISVLIENTSFDAERRKFQNMPIEYYIALFFYGNGF